MKANKHRKQGLVLLAKNRLQVEKEAHLSLVFVRANLSSHTLLVLVSVK